MWWNWHLYLCVSHFVDPLVCPPSTLLVHGYTQVHRFSPPKLAQCVHFRETDVSKCVWHQRWCFWVRTLPVPTLLTLACTQVRRFSQPKLAHYAHLRENDVSKCGWQQRWCFWVRTLPVPTLLTNTYTHHTIPHSPHTHSPHFHVHSDPLVSYVSGQVSFLRCDHETRY